jgi:Mn2+/Fe2+ NRAMP family transporter
MSIDLKNIIKTLGPGIIFAGAAIGGSHIIQSTRAGADYGFKLALIVILVNLFKYPFFEFGIRYTNLTGKSLIEGYKNLGNWAVWTYLILSIITGIINAAALSVVCSGVLSFILGINFSTTIYSIILLFFCMFLLTMGKYPLLDKAMKIMIVILTITSLIALYLAYNKGMSVIPDFVEPDVFSKKSVFFIIALMGWMPAPIELSAITSLWSIGRIEQMNYKPTFNESLIDFNIGYIGTIVLAIVFLSLGAFMMYGTGVEFQNSGVGFTNQLIKMYTDLFGSWSLYIIAPAAFFTLFSSLISVIDGYPRSYENSFYTLNFFKNIKSGTVYFWTIFLLVVFALIIIQFLAKTMTVMIDFATVISFLAAPVFAILNYRVVKGNEIPESYRPKNFLNILSIMGIIFFISFSLIYIYSLLFI